MTACPYLGAKALSVVLGSGCGVDVLDDLLTKGHNRNEARGCVHDIWTEGSVADVALGEKDVLHETSAQGCSWE